ncbi:MAG: MFS transporter [Candidatus Berkiellales bacterium]
MPTQNNSSALTSPRWHLGGWALWSISALYYAYEFIHRVAPSVLTSHLREAFSVNNHQLASIGAMYFYAYAAFQLPAGILIDRYGTKRILFLASITLTFGSFLFSTTSSSLVAHISRFMIGAGSAFAFIGCLKIGAQWLAMSSFPLVIGLTNLCGTLGALSGGTPLSYLVQQIGWREAMMYLSFAGIFITLLIWLFLEEKPTNHTSQTTSHGLFAGLWLVMKTPQSWLIAIYGALLVAPIAALPEMWGVEYLKMSHDIPETKAAAITHTIFIGTAVGGPLIGWFLTIIRDEVHFMMFATLGALSLLSLFLYWLHVPHNSLHLILFVYGVLTANMLLCFALMAELHPDWAQGAAIGFTNMIIMSSGGITQHAVGWILHLLKENRGGVALPEDYHVALSILPLCLVVALVISLFIKQALPQNKAQAKSS